MGRFNWVPGYGINVSREIVSSRDCFWRIVVEMADDVVVCHNLDLVVAEADLGYRLRHSYRDGMRG